MISRRVVHRLEDLTRDEVVDLWTTVHTIAPVLEKHFGGTGLSVAVQDGPSAGQTVPHVHVHIIPRVDGDFERNDEIYEELDRVGSQRGVDNESRAARSKDEMKEEASSLRPLFSHLSLPLPEDS